MTPKEKARDLILKHLRVNHGFNVHIARQCALIAVDEILEMDLPIFEEDCDEFYGYWQEVKQELEKL